MVREKTSAEKLMQKIEEHHEDFKVLFTREGWSIVEYHEREPTTLYGPFNTFEQFEKFVGAIKQWDDDYYWENRPDRFPDPDLEAIERYIA
jgi:hypothetical protein